MQLLIGTYPHGQNEFPAEGIWEVSFNPADGTLNQPEQKCSTESPSFIAVSNDGATVFAVGETHTGTLSQFTRTDSTLELAATVPTNGVEPCHVITVGTLVIATNYTTGSVCAYNTPLNTGATDGQFFQQSGTGPNAERQEGPHAHFAGQVPGTQYVWVTDLGADLINLYVVGTTHNGAPGLESRGAAVQFPAGAGPRHIAFSSNSHAYVVGELDNTIYTVQIDEATGRGEIVAATPITTEQLDGDNLASHIELDSTEKFLFVAIRGANIISVLSVTQTGTLEHQSSFPTHGAWPRHFRVLDSSETEQAHLKYVIVANQHSHTLDVTAYNTTTHTAELASSVTLPAPACIAPVE